MHILQIYKDYYPVLGGIENHIKVLSEGLSARGHRVTVLVTNTAPYDEHIHQGNLTIIKAARQVHLASTPLSMSMAFQARQCSDVDVINLHFPYPPGDLIARAVPKHPPLVVSYHSDIVRQKTLLRFYTPLLHRTLDYATCIVAATEKHILNSPWLHPRAAKCMISPYSVEPTRFEQQDTTKSKAIRSRYDGPIMLFVGRLRYYKGLHFMLEALPRMTSYAHLVLAGTGTEKERLKAMAQSLAITDRVHFLGDVSDEDLPHIYGAADVFVLPSHLPSEAFGIVQLEAQAAGLPIVSTELGTGTSIVNQHGKTGFVVPPANPTALAQALDVFIANPRMAHHMGAYGRQRVLHEFSHTHMIDRMEKIYHKVINHHLRDT